MLADLFPNDVTPEEHDAGFRLIDIAHPHPYSTTPKTIKAVVYQVDDSHRLVKHNIKGTINYTLEVFCAVLNFPPHYGPEWRPLDYLFCRHDPHTATQQVRRWIMDNQLPKQWDPKIPTPLGDNT